MKKIILIAILITACSASYAQEVKQDSTQKEFKNMFEIDVTELLHQYFINSDDDGPISFHQVLKYRRFINSKNALTLGVGVGSSERNSTDEETYQNYFGSRSYSIGLGFEHYVPLTRRWNFFFGAELLYNRKNSINQFREYGNGIDYQREESVAWLVGLNTYAGIEYKFSGRFSVATQVSYFLQYSQDNKEISFPANQSLQKVRVENSNLGQGFEALNVKLRFRF